MRQFTDGFRKPTARIFRLCALMCALTASAHGAPASTKAQPNKVSATDTIPIVEFTGTELIIAEPPAIFTQTFGRAAADSLEARLRNDHTLCSDDTVWISRDALFRWKTHIDSMVMSPSYPEKFRLFVATTGMKPQDVRPCEPVAFYERYSRQISVTDSTIAAQRAARDKAFNDSVAVINELRALKAGPADILNIPAGMSKNSIHIILERNKIRARSMPRALQADRILFDSLVVTIAFHFDENDRLSGYEVETEALRADQLDKTVRGWAERLTRAYGQRIGPPTKTNRVNFLDIKQGQMSITARWEHGQGRPRVLIGLATDNNLYYTKVMVNY